MKAHWPILLVLIIAGQMALLLIPGEVLRPVPPDQFRFCAPMNPPNQFDLAQGGYIPFSYLFVSIWALHFAAWALCFWWACRKRSRDWLAPVLTAMALVGISLSVYSHTHDMIAQLPTTWLNYPACVLLGSFAVAAWIYRRKTRAAMGTA